MPKDGFAGRPLRSQRGVFKLDVCYYRAGAAMVHGERRGLHHVAIEIRQDLIAEDAGQRAWGVLLARLLPQAYRALVAAEALRPA
jgi:predicted N-formylglutamate amidohydrolase